MKSIARKLSVSLGRSNGFWLTLLLLLVVLLPSGCLLWFMNQAVRNERLAVRQKLVDAYRGHLVLAQQQMEDYWKTLATGERFGWPEDTSPPAAFAKWVRGGLADAVVCFNPEGKVTYPDTIWLNKLEILDSEWATAGHLESSDLQAAATAFARLAVNTTNANLAARAWQAQARCLGLSGNKEAAISILTGPLAEDRYADTTDEQGRLIVPGCLWMAIELLEDSAPGQTGILVERLRHRLLDYDNSNLPAPQRRFLMRKLQAAFPDETVARMLGAEDLAARFIESGVPEVHLHEVRATSLPGIWQAAWRNGRMLTLHRTDTLVGLLQQAARPETLPPDVRLELRFPEQTANEAFVSLPAGAAWPGWRLALSLRDQRLFDTASNERTRFYLWTGAFAVGIVMILAVLALGLLRRQAALARLRNDLVANVTHELKTPLSSMRLLVETLLNSERLDEKIAREYLHLIATENVRLSRLIDNFLTFSRIERNKYSFEFKEVPAAAIAERAAAAVRERFNAPGCRFDVHIPKDLPRVRADADAMITALLNLLDNAYKYSGDTKEITFSAGAQNGSVTFAVKDNGIGLSTRDTKRVFKRFYQVDEHLSRSSGGAGLGLSIVQFVVTAHQGTVQVKSEPERGSTFAVTIPATDSHKPPGT